MNLISVGYGKMNFSDSSMSIAAFVLERPFIRKFPSQVYKKTATHVIHVSPYPEINGRLFVDTLSVPNNTIVMLQVGKRYRGSSVADGMVFVHVHEHGGLLNVCVRTITDPSSTVQNNTHTALVANGYILSDEDMEKLGFIVSERTIDTYRQSEEIDELFHITRLTEDVVPQPEPVILKSISGSEKVIHVPVVRRRIRVHR